MYDVCRLIKMSKINEKEICHLWNNSARLDLKCLKTHTQYTYKLIT